MRDITRIVVHCSATPGYMDIGREDIKRWHLDRGFSDVGYHFIIRRNGDIEMGRPVSKIGAHAQGFNTKSIGICMVGGVEIEDGFVPTNNFNPIQFENLVLLLTGLAAEYNVNPAHICGHCDLPGVRKACPSFDVQGWMDLWWDA